MKTSFFEFHVAISGLFTAKSSLSTISHNVANAATQGYSRQRAVVKASPPLGFNNGRGMVGTGSEVVNIEQVRDLFLDSKYWGESGVFGEYSAKTAQLTVIENIFNEMDAENGLSATCTSFFERASDVVTTANDTTFRTNLIQAGGSLAQTIKSEALALRKQQIDANNEISIVVAEINSLGIQIASLNKQIATFEMDGSKANDLRDERTRIMDKLSKLVNAEAVERDYGTPMNPNDKRYVVMINGYDFVSNYEMNELGVRERAQKLNDLDEEGLFDVWFPNLDMSFNIFHPNLKGQLRGLVDARDGTGTGFAGLGPQASNYKGMPYYMAKLSSFARTVARAIDLGDSVDTLGNVKKLTGVIGHVNGFNLEGNGNETGAPDEGTLFFTIDDGTGPVPETFSLTASDQDKQDFYDRMNCFNFIVNPALDRQPALLNCAPDPLQGESAYAVARGFGYVSSDNSLFREGKLQDYVAGISSEMGIDAYQAKKFEASYGDVLSEIENQRIAVAGVDMNEEMVNMIQNQQLYQASAKLVNVINTIYGTLINNLGA
ncbi:MAG: flagellar hook-associated protein FlgK [Clostridiales bacterium]|jgi:flagellar hook-associated protein 1 FlgK|nr:flagellar hook-associated protein FlgK [Clostridiales bacterium]